jgi:hypothetical protein
VHCAWLAFAIATKDEDPVLVALAGEDSSDSGCVEDQ